MPYVSKFMKISDEYFKESIVNSNFMVDVLEKLGYSRTSGTMTAKIKERAINLNISMDHFNVDKRGGGGVETYSLKEIMVENSFYTNLTRLKIRIINEKIIEYKCFKCGNIGEWNGHPLTLQLHHKNGINNDHRLKNLELLCPNCHTQTDTYGSKNSYYKD